MPKIVLPQKLPADTISVVFDFSSYLPLSFTLSSAVVTCSVYRGTDASPSSMVSGSATVSSPTATQKITGGTAGVSYVLECAGTFSNGLIYTLSGVLVVLQGNV